MKSIFEKLAIQRRLNLPFVVYRKPNSKTLVGVFQKDDHLYYTDDFKEQGFVFAPFSGPAIVIPVGKSEVKYNSIYFDHIFENKIVDVVSDTTLKEDFVLLVQKGIETIQSGVCSKIVLSRTELIELGDFKLELVFEQMLHKYSSAFCYCWYHPKIGMWLGATPEKLVSIEKDKFQTMSLAGTQQYTGTDVVFWKNKERKEQEIVTDYISVQLKNKVNAISVSEPYTARAGNLLHLRTDIEGVLEDNTNLKNLIETLHPTPAVCGMPKDLAKAFIETNEGYDREFYTGFLGELNYDFTTSEKATSLMVNLRCMKIKNNQAQLFIGCGITVDSDPIAEWEETINKSKTMRQIL